VQEKRNVRDRGGNLNISDSDLLLHVTPRTNTSMQPAVSAVQSVHIF